MLAELKAALRPAFTFILLLTVLIGIVYPLIILAFGQAIFPYQANGSLVREGDRVVGSALIGQPFEGPTYFHPRPSAAGDGYDAAASSGSNLGPTSADLKASVEERVAEARAEGVTGAVPAAMATASASGLDPDISPEMALAQVARVAAARGLPAAQVRGLVDETIRQPALGILGESTVNVLLLNRQLDRMSANAAR